jgi:hypothetical protein
LVNHTGVAYIGSVEAAELKTDGLESRNLKLKGKSQEVDACIIRI